MDGQEMSRINLQKAKIFFQNNVSIEVSAEEFLEATISQKACALLEK